MAAIAAARPRVATNRPSAAVVDIPAPQATDNCAGEAQLAEFTTDYGNRFDVGTTTVTLTVDDGEGNKGMCTVNVTVTDAEGPKITCPSDIVVNSGSVVEYEEPSTKDNCGDEVLEQTVGQASGTVFPDGITTNSFLVTDTIPDACDADDDNDGVADADDSAPLDKFICRDVDADTCDDCSSGNDAPADDGTDTDADGLCNVGDVCPNDADNDADADGVCGDVDVCAGTPPDVAVDEIGCSIASLKKVH